MILGPPNLITLSTFSKVTLSTTMAPGVSVMCKVMSFNSAPNHISIVSLPYRVNLLELSFCLHSVTGSKSSCMKSSLSLSVNVRAPPTPSGVVDRNPSPFSFHPNFPGLQRIDGEPVKEIC